MPSHSTGAPKARGRHALPPHSHGGSAPSAPSAPPPPSHSVESRDQRELGAASGPQEVGDPRRIPGSEVLALPPARVTKLALSGLMPFERFGKRRERQTGAASFLDHRRKPCRALVPPVTEQLSVERADQQPRTAAVRPVVAEPLGHSRDEVARMLARAPRSSCAIVRPARVRPGTQAVHARGVVVAIDRIRRVTAVVPNKRDRSPVDRDCDNASLTRHRLELIEPVAGCRLVDAESPYSSLRQLRVDARAKGALRQPEAAGPRSEPRPVRIYPGEDLKADTGLGCEQRQDRVRRRGSPKLEHPGVVQTSKRTDQVAVERLVELGGVLVVACRFA